MKTKFLLCCFAALFCTQLFAQKFINKQRHFGNPLAGDRIDIRRTVDGGYVTCAVMFRGGGSIDDYKMNKFDSMGRMQKALTIGGSDADESFSITPTQDHGYLVAGISQSDISGDKTAPLFGEQDFWLVKLDSLGHIQWDKTFGTTNDEERMVYVDTTLDGGYIFGGTANGGFNGGMYVMRLDSEGNIMWDKTLLNEGNGAFFEKVLHTSDGGFIVAGNSESHYADPTEFGEDYYIVKLDGAGNTVWSKLFGSGGGDNLFDIIATPDGGYLASGESNAGVSYDKTEPSKGSYDYWLVKMDANGNKQWDKTLGGSGVESLPHVANTSDGGYIVGGSSNSGVSGDRTEPNRGSGDYWVVKIDTNGQVQWDKTFGGSGEDEGSMILEYKKNEYIIGGVSGSSVSGDRTVPNNGSHFDDFWVVGFKYVPETNTIVADNQFTAKSITSVADGAFKVYPNPAKDVIHIQAKGNNSYKLVNANGKPVLTTTINGSGSINISQLPAGVYYLQNSLAHSSTKVIITH